MASVRIVRKKSGKAKQNKKGQYVFTKEGVYFALNEEQMNELKVLMGGILDGSLIEVQLDSDEIVVDE